MTILMCRFCGQNQYRPVLRDGGGYRCSSCYSLLSMDGIPLTEPPEPPTDRPEPAEEIPFGKYNLRKEVGRGSMGIVYDAHEPTLNRRVAVKIMFTRRSDDPKEAMAAWQRFIQEARLSANLDRHPNLVTVHEAGVHEGRRFIAMEFIEGKPFTVWRSETNATRRDQVRILRTVALAVHYAHEAGIIHRDLKPANVLIDDRNIPYVADFGVAKSFRSDAARSDTPSGLIVGSPAYMSPEQALGQGEVERRTDVYSLGIMLYEIIAGKVPFEGSTPIDVMRRASEETATAPSLVKNNGAPPTPDAVLDKISLRAMARKPAARYATAREFADELGRWLDDLEAPPIPERKTSRARVAWAAGILASLAAGGIFMAWDSIETRRLVREHTLEGRMRLNEGQTQKALLAFERALALEGNDAGALEGRSIAAERLEAALAKARTKRDQDERRLKEVEVKLLQMSAVPIDVPLKSFKDRNVKFYRVDDRIHFLVGGVTVAPVTIPDSGEYEIQVVASCRKAGSEFAKFRLQVDERPTEEIALTGEEPRLYTLTCPLDAGVRVLGLRFTNDYYNRELKQDRNLFIHSVILRRIR